MFSVCILSLLRIFSANKREVKKRVKAVKAIEIIFMLSMEVWSLGITYVDTVSHGIIDLLVYITVLTLLPSIIFIRPRVGVPVQIVLDACVYFMIFTHGLDRAKYLFINFTSYAGVGIIIYLLTYNIQYELYEREAMLKKAAENDSLTDLKNRFSFSSYIQMLKDHPENRQFAILLLDLNGLKTTNDTIGHTAGDELIKGAAWCIWKAFHKNGVCFRTGGDEFVVILNKRLTEIQPMLRTFESLCGSWKGEIISSPSVSFGLAEALEEPEMNVDQLIELADQRMYVMKEKYYNQKGVDRRKNVK